MGTKYEIEERRKKAWNLKMAGVTYSKIAETLHISTATAVLDINAMVKMHLSEFEKKDEITAKVYANIECVIEESWKLFRVTQNENVKLGALKKVCEATDRLLLMAGYRQYNVNQQNVQTVFNLQQVIEKVPKEYVEVVNEWKKWQMTSRTQSATN